MANTVYIDGTNLRLGRMATSVAKTLMGGEKVVIVNVEKVAVSGSRSSVLAKYQRWIELRTYKNPEDVGPKQHRSPDRLMFNAVKGMLPKGPTGKDALKRLKVYIGVPDDLRSVKLERIDEADVRYLKGSYMRLEEISRSLGWAV